MDSSWIGPASGQARVIKCGWTARLCGALALILLPWAAQGDHLSEYHYTVLRGGEAIGTHRVTVSPDGRDLKIEAETEFEVSFGPLTFYRMEHLRQEVWRNGELEEMTAYTNKNGDVYDIAITRDSQGYKRVINGRTDRFEPSMKLLTLWHEDLFRYSSFVSPMEDKTYQISVDFVTADKIDLIDRSVDAVAYRMSGDTNRELWYDAQGHIMKVRLLDHSVAIEYVLDSMSEVTTKLAEAGGATPGHHGPVTRLADRR